MKTGAFVHMHVKVYLCYFTRNVTFLNCILFIFNINTNYFQNKLNKLTKKYLKLSKKSTSVKINWCEIPNSLDE